MPEVRRIAKHRHVPRIIKKAAEAERVQRDKERRKVTPAAGVARWSVVLRLFLLLADDTRLCTLWAGNVGNGWRDQTKKEKIVHRFLK